MKRHADALLIQSACNPSGIAHALIDACREMRETLGHKGTDEICQDPAIRLMVHQLAFLTNQAEFERDFMAYSRASDDCENATP